MEKVSGIIFLYRVEILFFILQAVVFRYNLCRIFGRPSHISSEFLGSEGVKIGSGSANSCIGCRATSKLLKGLLDAVLSSVVLSTVYFYSSRSMSYFIIMKRQSGKSPFHILLE